MNQRMKYLRTGVEINVQLKVVFKNKMQSSVSKFIKQEKIQCGVFLTNFF